MVLAAFLAFLLALAFLAWLDFKAGPAARRLKQARRTVEAYQVFFEAIREIAWDHRDINPELAAILADEFRTFNRNKIPKVKK